MVEFAISPDDVAALREVLASALSDLRYEINDTDSLDYREKLRLKQGALERVIAQLGSA
jgi:hypothetical protein